MSIASLRRLQTLAVAVLLAAAPGCGVTPVRIEPEMLNRLKDEAAIHVVQYQPTVMSLRTRLGDAVLSLNPYGGAVPDSTSRAADMTRDYALADPAARVGEQVVASLASQLGLQNLRVAPAVLDGDEPEALRSRLPGGLVLDFRTLAWVLRFDPNRLFSYFVAYVGRGRLIRLDTGQVIWQGICRSPFPAQTEPTLSQLTANGGALLRAKSDAAADRCATQLLDQFFGGESSRLSPESRAARSW